MPQPSSEMILPPQNNTVGVQLLAGVRGSMAVAPEAGYTRIVPLGMSGRGTSVLLVSSHSAVRVLRIIRVTEETQTHWLKYSLEEASSPRA